MAGKDRTQAHDLILAYLEAQDLKRAGLFPVLRQLEARAEHLPRLGTAKRPEHSIADLAQEPVTGFAASTLAGYAARRGRVELRGHWLGLTGPMGPMPVHVTEFAQVEKLYAKKHPFGDWLDLLANRMLQMFYRAWAQSQPATHADRPDEEEGFATWVAALTGYQEGASKESPFLLLARMHYAPLYSGMRSASAIEDGLTHLLRQPVRVTEYLPKWRKLEPEDRTRLGRDFAVLGSDAVLGSEVFSASDAFRVIVRAESYRDYLSLMPEGDRFAIAADAIDAFKPTHLEWELCIEIAEKDVQPARLDGRSRIGWNSWMQKPQDPGDAYGRIRADAHLRRSNMKRRRQVQ